jgi:hypothetical protein
VKNEPSRLSDPAELTKASQSTGTTSHLGCDSAGSGRVGVRYDASTDVYPGANSFAGSGDIWHMASWVRLR